MKKILISSKVSLFISSILLLSSCSMKIDDGNYLEFRHQQNLEKLKKHMDSFEIKYFYDKKYDIKLFYPDFFSIVDTCPGAISFKYSNYEHRLTLKLSVDSSLVRTDVEKAIDYQIYLSDSAAVCIDRGENYYVMKSANSLKKGFLIGSNWFEYTLYYNIYCGDMMERLINLLKDWDPRKEHKK